jgi:hypothetical protein
MNEQHINSSDPLSPPVIDPNYFGHKFGKIDIGGGRLVLLNPRFTDVAFHAITTAWLRKWMHAEPISELLVNENAPGADSVNTFDEWATYARSNAIVSHPSYSSRAHAYLLPITTSRRSTP